VVAAPSGFSFGLFIGASRGDLARWRNRVLRLRPHYAVISKQSINVIEGKGGLRRLNRADMGRSSAAPLHDLAEGAFKQGAELRSDYFVVVGITGSISAEG
jgi:hypothetical protein